MQVSEFAPLLINWQRQHGRHDLPWQVEDPYRIWLSEIMLQQTQVTTVLDYYPRFLQRFPDVASLAAASVDDVLALWSGLGYYSRARNLHKAAQQVMTDFNGNFPSQREQLQTLCGVGRSTAAAIAAFAFHQRETILDGNVKRVLTRVFGITGFPGERAIEQQLWALAEQLLPAASNDMPDYIQGLMDLGALLCARGKPACGQCPMRQGCIAYRDNRTAELPTRKPRKPVPTRHIMLLIAQDKDRIYFERRPPTGIWGGLLCLPECTDSDSAQQLLDKLGDGELTVSLPEFEHQLTHFRLIITPQPAELQRRKSSRAAENGGQWLTADEAIAAGLPTPVRRILTQYCAPGLFNRETP